MEKFISLYTWPKKNEKALAVCWFVVKYVDEQDHLMLLLLLLQICIQVY